MTFTNPDTVKLIEHDSTIERSYGNLPLFTVRPEVEGPLPALILVHEIFGLNNHIRDVARRFARQGIVVFAPDLFAGHSSAPDNRDDLNAMRNLWSTISDDQLISDLQAVFANARGAEFVRSNAIGTLGYCMGGAISFLFATRTPLLAWCIDYYGRIYYPGITEFKPRHPIDYTGGLNCPFLALFAGVDDLIPPEQIKLFEDKLEDLGKSYTLKVYPNAKHAFFNDQREFYHYEAAADAWLITLDFIALHSGSKPEIV
ncbi:MAG: dienelactone hydrolase family protein [Candidatus Obscuribacterales bacterium]|nr:dienelactone hydrolase family protein [Candidatus Obscuribacterales bacterium]